MDNDDEGDAPSQDLALRNPQLQRKPSRDSFKSKDQPQNQFNPAISDFQSALGAKSAKTGYGATRNALQAFDSNNSRKPLIAQE